MVNYRVRYAPVLSDSGNSPTGGRNPSGLAACCACSKLSRLSSSPITSCISPGGRRPRYSTLKIARCSVPESHTVHESTCSAIGNCVATTGTLAFQLVADSMSACTSAKYYRNPHDRPAQQILPGLLGKWYVPCSRGHTNMQTEYDRRNVHRGRSGEARILVPIRSRTARNTMGSAMWARFLVLDPPPEDEVYEGAHARNSGR